MNRPMNDITRSSAAPAGVTTWLYRQPRIFALAILMILALGATASLTIGRQEDPTITNLFATVVTPFPGAAPARVEALVTEKIEAELRQIPDIKTLTSVSSTGVSSVQIELSEFTPKERIEQVWSEIRDALSDATVEFPAGVPEPDFDDDRTGAFTAILAYQPIEGRPAQLPIISRYAEAAQDRLRRLPGTEFVDVFGGVSEEILVEIDPDRVASLGLTPDAVSAAIAGADAKVRAGRVRGDDSDYLLEISGEIDSLDRVRLIPIATSADGPVARVADVASVRRAFRDPPDELAFVNGRRAVLVAARMEADLQVDTWMGFVREEIDLLAAEAPDSVTVDLLFDQSEYTTARLMELAQNVALGVGIVVAVLFVTLGWRSALVVGTVLPLTALFSLVVLQRLGIVIHQMSVTGMIVALGLLVDAAIVMTDEIRKKLAAGMPRLEAVGGSVRRLAAPLLASTITTVLAFVPMAVLPGPAGDFVGSIALSVITMLVVSFVLALTITPALAGYILPARAPDAPPRRAPLVGRIYRGTLDAALAWRPYAALIAATPAVLGFLAFPTLTAQFFPGVERNQFYVQVSLPDGVAIAQTAETAQRLDARLRQEDGVAGVEWVVGRSAPAFYYNMQANRDLAPSFAEALVTTTDGAAAERLIRAMQPALDAAAPEAQVLVRGLVQGPPVAAPIEMRIIGPDLDALRDAGEEARRVMSSLPAVTHTRSDLAGGAPKLVFALDEDKVRLAGLTLSDVARQLETLLEGTTGGSLLEGSEELPVRVRIGAEDRAAADSILALTITPPGAAATAASGAFPGIPLAALGALSLEPSESPITRRNGERANTVQGFIQRGVLPEEALRDLQERLEEQPIDLPPGARIEWGGDSDARGEVVTNLLSSVSLVVTLTIATIVLTFNSWRLSIIAFVVAGLSFGLSILALAIFQFPFGINALIGAIGSIGVSINAAIIIMTALQEDPRAARGDRRAIADVVQGSSRHIVSTTVTTFGGFLPLILDGGLFWPPFAMAVAGGVLLSTIVSLYFVPAVYSLAIGRRAEREAQRAALGPAPAVVA